MLVFIRVGALPAQNKEKLKRHNLNLHFSRENFEGLKKTREYYLHNMMVTIFWYNSCFPLPTSLSINLPAKYLHLPSPKIVWLNTQFLFEIFIKLSTNLVLKSVHQISEHYNSIRALSLDHPMESNLSSRRKKFRSMSYLEEYFDEKYEEYCRRYEE